MKEIEIIPCPFCGDLMKACRAVMNQPKLDGVTHKTRNNNCPVGIGVYKISVWNNRRVGHEDEFGPVNFNDIEPDQLKPDCNSCGSVCVETKKDDEGNVICPGLPETNDKSKF